MRCNHHHHRHPNHLYAMSPEVLLKSDGHFKGQNPTNIFSNPPGKSCRYNTSGFVEELPKLPENRGGHVCAALPSTEVRPTQSNILQAFVVAGGWDGSSRFSSRRLSSVYILLSGGKVWTSLASLPRVLHGARASVVGGKIRVTGGFSEGSYRSEVIVINMHSIWKIILA